MLSVWKEHELDCIVGRGGSFISEGLDTKKWETRFLGVTEWRDLVLVGRSQTQRFYRIEEPLTVVRMSQDMVDPGFGVERMVRTQKRRRRCPTCLGPGDNTG